MNTAVIFSKSLRKLKLSEEYSPSLIRKKLLSAGINAENFIIEGREIRSKCRDLSNSKFDAVIAAGGDGTINSIASALIGKNMPLGIIPLGTFNHFAKDLNIPLNIDDALRVILKSKLKKIDAGQVNEEFFINNSSIGLYPRIVWHRKSVQERLGGNKWLAMGTAVSRVITRFPNLKVEIESEEKSEYFETPIVFVGNNVYQMDVFNLGKRSALDEGKLGVYYIKSGGRFSILKTVFLALTNMLHQSKVFQSIVTKKIKIDSGKSHLTVSLDGEIRKLKVPLEYKIVPQSLNVIIP